MSYMTLSSQEQPLFRSDVEKLEVCIGLPTTFELVSVPNMVIEKLSVLVV